ncbi:hypothetical protein EB796_001532 [Bugula neritina]|uniref:AAA+ ATPase domain-containing protein n=1 Tax=Bugula neritina TaxID=10212 RepID=A0A7J7KQ04_BUGNE|nr:hypothetical protein EB796_001532 [Bugula neritina]
MALITTNPQSQITCMWSGLRHLTAGQPGRQKVLKKSVKEEANTQSANKHTLPSCVLILKEVDLNPITLNVIGSRSSNPSWWVSHTSANSFQQNIQASDAVTSSRVREVCSAVFDSRHLHLSSTLLNNIMCQQTRGFKTKRSESSGLNGAKKLGRVQPIKVPASSNNANFVRLTDILYTYYAFPSNILLKGFLAGSDWKAVPHGLNNAGLNALRVQAFLEGYRSYSLSNQLRADGRQGFGSKVAVSLVRNLLFICVIAAFVLLISPKISVRKVSLFNGEEFEISPETVSVRFDDVRGSAEAKAELANIVDFLKNPEKYTELGAKLPNGCLLVGPPGVGKTLLAKAVAGEADVPFFQASGAEFDEVYVGTGAKRVRQLFQAAKAKSPCVIFIDEIDSVGSKRTSSELHPYANQTVNQLLTEMDGFQPNEGVIVLGATNKKNNLDKALLRPGRFDVEVHIKVPDLNERIEILNLYMPKLVTDNTVDVITVAKRTTGCTGADLNNICNHAAIQAAITGSSVVTMEHVEFAIDKVQMGPQKKRIQSETVNRNTAYHEAGHALIQYFCRSDAKKLHKITILPRGQALGMTHFISDERSQFQMTREDMLADIDALMGGRIAEEITFGENKVTTGASSDMNRATSLATHMVRNFGFSDKIGLRVYSSDKEIISERIKDEIDQEIKQILKESYERAKKLLLSKQKELGWLAQALLDFEELTYEEAKIIIEGGKLNKTIKPAGPSPPPPKMTCTNLNHQSPLNLSLQ